MALPSEEDYRPPSPPPQRELGPPPPGHGRFVDYGRGGVGRGSDGLPPRRNLDEVLCFKVRLYMFRERVDSDVQCSAV